MLGKTFPGPSLNRLLSAETWPTAAIIFLGVFVAGRLKVVAPCLPGLFQDNPFSPKFLWRCGRWLPTGLGALHFSQLVELGADGLDALQKFLLAAALFLENLMERNTIQ